MRPIRSSLVDLLIGLELQVAGDGSVRSVTLLL